MTSLAGLPENIAVNARYRRHMCQVCPDLCVTIVSFGEQQTRLGKLDFFSLQYLNKTSQFLKMIHHASIQMKKCKLNQQTFINESQTKMPMWRNFVE